MCVEGQGPDAGPRLREGEGRHSWGPIPFALIPNHSSSLPLFFPSSLSFLINISQVLGLRQFLMKRAAQTHSSWEMSTPV